MVNIARRLASVVALLSIFAMLSLPTAQGMPKNETPVASKIATTVAPCNNSVVKWIYAAGFRGRSLRIGWAIVMRESNGRPRTISNGADYGLWQINVPTHPGYSRAALLDPVRNSRIAYRLSNGGKNFRPWGIGVTSSGRVYMDSRDYDGIWSQWQKDHWIWLPFIKYYRAYPC